MIVTVFLLYRVIVPTIRRPSASNDTRSPIENFSIAPCARNC